MGQRNILAVKTFDVTPVSYTHLDVYKRQDEHDECVYSKAAENFQLFQDKGSLVQDSKENYYIYAQTMNGKTQSGLVVGAYVPDYMNGVIKKHELTRRDKEEDRMKPVSYTHLDVYKRQLLSCWLPRISWYRQVT